MGRCGGHTSVHPNQKLHAVWFKQLIAGKKTVCGCEHNLRCNKGTRAKASVTKIERDSNDADCRARPASGVGDLAIVKWQPSGRLKCIFSLGACLGNPLNSER